MRTSIFLALSILLFCIVFCIGLLINATGKTTQTTISVSSSFESEDEDEDEDVYYTNLVNKEVPYTENESPEVTKYRNDLKQWLEWDNECMGMDPKSRPKDPRIK